MSTIQLTHLMFFGPQRPRADVEFRPGLNVICGASETGKSFLVECVDFMLGGSDPPKDIPERTGYDRIRMVIKSSDSAPLTLERSIEGGDFASYEEAVVDSTPASERKVLREKHSGAREDSVSQVLLRKVRLAGKQLRKNRKSEVRSLSFRDVARLIIVNEGEIQRQGSPLLSGQYILATAEYAAFKLLLTGIDDSSLVTVPDLSSQRAQATGRLELLDEMIASLQTENDEKGEVEEELQKQLAKLETTIEEQNAALRDVQAELDKLLEDRARVAKDIQRRRARLAEIRELTERFRLLDEHYQSDLARLEAIQESGSLFAHLERVSCPMCGAGPGNQHLDADCDGNVESIVQAASAEMDKIVRLRRELGDTVGSLVAEEGEIGVELPEVEQEYATLDEQLSKVAAPAVSSERAGYNELVSERAEVRSSLSKFLRLRQLVEQKQELEEAEEESTGAGETRTSIQTSVLEEFAQTVERILKEWNYPHASRVFFDESKRDFVIEGKARGSTGKGLRAITHAAVSVGIMEFCLERNLPHPGLLVLDSPLLAYWKPEGDEDNLAGTDLKDRFYQYLLGMRSDTQIIIIENEHPADEVMQNANVVVFTKNPQQGRYGLFPPQNNGR